MRTIQLLVTCSILCCGGVAYAQTTQPDDSIEKMLQLPDPASGHHWQDEASARHWPQADIDSIKRDKILFGQREFKQIFDPYLSSRYPLFVTSDSVLNAYHVLFEESVRRVELADAGKLASILHDLWEPLLTADSHVTGDAAMIAAAKLRAQVTIAVALTLLGDESLQPDATLAPIIAAEVKKVREATAIDKPAWLGPPDPDFVAIDYSRFAPRGFYTQFRRLQGYFRAVAWLQAIPFRINNDQELLSAAMIGCAGKSHRYDEIESLFGVFDELLGKPDDPDLKMLVDTSSEQLQLDLKSSRDLTNLRGDLIDQIQASEATPEINDQLRFPPQPGSGISLRVLSARRTPDAVLFQHLMDKSNRAPSGLEVAAALGSAFARQLLPQPAPPNGPLFDLKHIRWSSLYCEYLYCLQALLAPPEKDVPALFSSRPWQAKSCQTVLGGWAQLRHTWQLQAKENIEYLGITLRPAGFVEPVPEFYSRMAALCERAGFLVQKSKAEGPDFAQLGDDARELISLLEKDDIGTNGKPEPHTLTPDELNRFGDMLRLARLSATDPLALDDPRRALKTLVADFDKGKLPDLAGGATWLPDAASPDLRELWQRLEMICRRLDALSNKQLRGADFSEEENQFLKDYGSWLAGVMLYGGNSYEVPRDDAPRIADVCQNPRSHQFLEVGIGRPRALYVLYPYHGGEILCEGAVMPYYEFPQPQPLTDSAWKTILDSKTHPTPFIPTAHR
jgi:hypothetical protein